VPLEGEAETAFASLESEHSELRESELLAVHYQEVEAGMLFAPAEEVGKRLLDFYERPPEDPAEILARVAKGETNLDPLREFTGACRREQAKALQQVMKAF
jgi:hypothetical protein